MTDNDLQRFAPDAGASHQTPSSPEFRFTNYTFAPQRLDERQLPQDLTDKPALKAAK